MNAFAHCNVIYVDITCIEKIRTKWPFVVSCHWNLLVYKVSSIWKSSRIEGIMSSKFIRSWVRKFDFEQKSRSNILFMNSKITGKISNRFFCWSNKRRVHVPLCSINSNKSNVFRIHLYEWWKIVIHDKYTFYNL